MGDAHLRTRPGEPPTGSRRGGAAGQDGGVAQHEIDPDGTVRLLELPDGVEPGAPIA
jgi:hypothetical protein